MDPEIFITYTRNFLQDCDNAFDTTIFKWKDNYTEQEKTTFIKNNIKIISIELSRTDFNHIKLEQIENIVHIIPGICFLLYNKFNRTINILKFYKGILPSDKTGYMKPIDK